MSRYEEFEGDVVRARKLTKGGVALLWDCARL